VHTCQERQDANVGFWGGGVGVVLGLMLAKQALYYLSHSISEFILITRVNSKILSIPHKPVTLNSHLGIFYFKVCYPTPRGVTESLLWCFFEHVILPKVSTSPYPSNPTSNSVYPSKGSLDGLLRTLLSGHLCLTLHPSKFISPSFVLLLLHI
jgi:hypothetical protein